MRLSRPTAATRLTLGGAVRVSSLAVLFAAGVLLAGALSAGAQETTTATTVETTTEPTTVITTATVERTTTRRIVPTGITTSASSSGDETPAWVWVLLGILAAGLVALIVLLARRGGGGGGGTVPLEERGRRLDTAVRSWTAQGWALESQSGDSAVLLRGGERLLVGIDQAGRVTTLPLPSQREG